MLGTSVDTTVILCLAIAIVGSLLLAAIMRPKHVRKHREFRRRGLS